MLLVPPAYLIAVNQRRRGGYTLADGSVSSDHLRMTAERTFREAPVVSCGPGLLLRGHLGSDLAGIVDMCQDPEMQRWTTIPVRYGHDEAVEFLAQVRQGWTTGAAAGFAIQLNGEFAGNLDLRLEQGSWAEVGYAMAAWARGHGVMTRALWTALRWGFTALNLEGVHWRAQVGNEASKRVAEKCGFKLEGTARALLLQVESLGVV